MPILSVWSAVRVLLLDNYDSFSHNLVQALRVLGADVVVRRHDDVDVAGALALGADAYVISPGPRTPAEAGISVDLVRACIAARLPLLGVCLGHQAIGAACGAAVVRADRLRHGKTSPIRHDGQGLFARAPSPFEAMRYHSLVIAEPLPTELVPTAWVTRDGASDELMGIRHRSAPVVGVQFHPESFMTPEGPLLLDNFLALARGIEVPA